jgi:thioredoxin-like negative regulator of GroEL
MEAALPRAAHGGKPLLLEFYKPDCGFCTRLHAEIYADAAVAEILDSMLKARADISTPSGAALAGRLGVTVFPSLLAVSAAGDVLERLEAPSDAAAARAFLDRIEALRSAPPSSVEQWVQTGDFASTAEALSFAESCYRKALQAGGPDASPLAEGTRLRLARVQERRGDRKGAAETLDPFVATTGAPGPAVRPALDLLIRIRKTLGDEDGEARARAAFSRLFPALKPAE